MIDMYSRRKEKIKYLKNSKPIIITDELRKYMIDTISGKYDKYTVIKK